MKEIQLLQSKAYDYLKDLIINDKLEHGIIYSQKKAADELGISKTPLRDAVLRLEQERYIDVYPSKGFVIHEMEESEIRETYQLRSALETYCLRKLISEPESTKAKKCMDALKDNMEIQDAIIKTSASGRDFARKDYEFHRTVVEYQENATMLHLYKDYMHRIFWLTVLSFTQKGRMTDTLNEHHRMIEAIQNGDKIALEEILENHLLVAEDINLRLKNGN